MKSSIIGKRGYGWLAAATAFLLSLHSYAQSISIGDQSFEVTSSVSAQATTLTNPKSASNGYWTATSYAAAPALGSPTVTLDSTASGLTGTVGSKVSFVSFSGLVGSGTISQTLGTNFASGTTYTLTLNVAVSTLTGLATNTFINLQAAGTTVSSYNSVNLVNLLQTANQFYQISLSYTATSSDAGKAIGLSFGTGAVASLSGTTYFDNAQLMAVPEPGVSFHLVWCAGWMVLRRRRWMAGWTE
ncbi:MAG: hypothetical protein QM796_09005 [Chthoniobacteraceae bacterium]